MLFEKSISDSCISSCQDCQSLLSPRGSWLRSVLPRPSGAYMPLSLGGECFIFLSISINCWGLAALFASLWSIRTRRTAKRAREKRPNGIRLCRYKTPAWRKRRIGAAVLSFNLWRGLGIGELCCARSLECNYTSPVWDDLCQFFQWFTQLVTLTFVVWSHRY